MIVVTNNNRMGKNLKTLRRKHNMSQEALARLVGIEIDTLDNIEQGAVLEINAQVLTKICREFRVTVQMLMEDVV